MYYHALYWRVKSIGEMKNKKCKMVLRWLIIMNVKCIGKEQDMYVSSIIFNIVHKSLTIIESLELSFF